MVFSRVDEGVGATVIYFGEKIQETRLRHLRQYLRHLRQYLRQNI